METKTNYPEKCPITGRPFFMEIEDEHGELVPTYGGVFDSYTIPIKDESDGVYFCIRYCHDRGEWIGEEDIDERLILDEHKS